MLSSVLEAKLRFLEDERWQLPVGLWRSTFGINDSGRHMTPTSFFWRWFGFTIGAGMAQVWVALLVAGLSTSVGFEAYLRDFLFGGFVLFFCVTLCSQVLLDNWTVANLFSSQSQPGARLSYGKHCILPAVIIVAAVAAYVFLLVDPKSLSRSFLAVFEVVLIVFSLYAHGDHSFCIAVHSEKIQTN